MTVLELPGDAGASPPTAGGGDSESSSGSSSSTATGGAAESLADRIKTARELKGWTQAKLDKEAALGGGTAKAIEEQGRMPGPAVLSRIGDALGIDANPLPDHPTKGATSEKRPSADGKAKRRPILGRKPRAESGGTPNPQTRPSVRRVTTSPLTESIITFAAGGLERIGQGPLGAFASFTAPVAGEIVDDVVAGTMVDKVVQPLVRGSEKYQNLGALFAGYASIAWATNVPEAADQAYGLFRWSMMTLLPLQGKEMARRAKEQRKALEAMAEIEPELVEMFGPDPIRGLWTTIWARQPEPAAAEEPANA